MQISKEFVVRRPPEQVWALLSEPTEVAGCIPGFELKQELSAGVYAGQFTIRVGPMTARLEGQGTLQTDDAARTGSVEGKGVDRRGGSQASAKLHYGVEPAPDGATIKVVADVVLSGPLAQVGRTGIIEDIADRLTDDFVKQLEARLAEPSAGETPAKEAAAGEAQAGEAQAGEPQAKAATPQEFDVGNALWAGLRRRLCRWWRSLWGGAR